MLTDLQIKQIPAPESRVEYPDQGGTRGLVLIVQPSGLKSWALRYRVHGVQRKYTIGGYPEIGIKDARRKAEKARGEIADGKDPAADKTAARATAKAKREAESDLVAAVVRSYVERYVKRNVGDGWGREIERLLKVEILPEIGNKHIADVGKRHILDLLDGIVDRGSPITANRTLAALRRMFNWTVERGIIGVSPCAGIKAPSAEHSRDRVLSDDEIRLAWNAFNSVGRPFGPIAKLLLLTGARRDEIASARWSEIDLEAKTWTIAKERSKNGVAHEIPLSRQAVEIIESLPRIGGKKDGFVFTTTGETAVSGFSKARAALDAAILSALRAEAKARCENSEEVTAPAHWTLHDLRRSAASGMAGLGIPPHVVEAVLNHKSGSIKGVAAVYNRYTYSAEKRTALDVWALVLYEIVAGASGDRLKTLRERALPFVSTLKGSDDEKRAVVKVWLQNLDAVVTGAEASNVIAPDFAKARAS